MAPPRVLWSPHDPRACIVSDADIRLWEAAGDGGRGGGGGGPDFARRRVFHTTKVLSVMSPAQHHVCLRAARRAVAVRTLCLCVHAGARAVGAGGSPDLRRLVRAGATLRRRAPLCVAWGVPSRACVLRRCPRADDPLLIGAGVTSGSFVLATFGGGAARIVAGMGRATRSL